MVLIAHVSSETLAMYTDLKCDIYVMYFTMRNVQVKNISAVNFLHQKTHDHCTKLKEISYSKTRPWVSKKRNKNKTLSTLMCVTTGYHKGPKIQINMDNIMTTLIF